VRVDETKGDTRFGKGEKNHSMLGIPIQLGEQFFGVLEIGSRQVAAFDQDFEEIMATLGSNLASVIRNNDLVEQVKRQVERQRMLFDITNRIRRSSDMETILETSVREIAKAMDVKKASVVIHSPENAEEENIVDKPSRNES
jgi:GAF domain-containing protein